MKIRELLSKLQSVRRQGKGWMARCPSHDDKKASLSISEGDDGRILLHCHAGCSVAGIAGALGVAVSELFPAREGLTASPASKRNTEPRKRIIATYDYRDEAGTLLFQAVRFDPKGFSQRRPDGGGGWLWNLNGVRRVLYCLPELLAADPGASVFVVEGEKDVEVLREAGLIATTNPQGAGKWRDEFNETLRGREVVILPDNDEPGRKHAEAVAHSLYRIAASVRVVHLPGLPEKGDVSNWLTNSGDAESLCVMAEAAPEWIPAESREAMSVETSDDSSAILHTWGELEMLPLPAGEQILHELERGEIGLLNSVTNIGKSTLLRNVAICAATGRHFTPVKADVKTRRVLLADFETRKIKLQRDLKRMALALTSEERVLLRENFAVICDAAINDEPICLSHPDHLAWLEIQAKAFRADLIIVDTFAAAFSVREENSSGEIGARVFRPLAALARETGAAIMLAHHIGKSGSEEGRGAEKAYRGRGSSAFGTWPSLILNLFPTQAADCVTLSLAKVKGERFDDVNLSLDRQSRWFSLTDAPASQPANSYSLVMNLFCDECVMKTREVITALAGQVAVRTVKQCLAEAVKCGDLSQPRKGQYQRSASRASTINSAQPALPEEKSPTLYKVNGLAH